jgi:hypothetical protein
VKRLLIAMALCLPIASQAAAASNDRASLAPSPAPSHPRSFDFRLVHDPEFDSTPVRNSGLIGQTELAPNASLGFGLLNVSSRRLSSGEWRYDARGARSKKASVRFVLKF